VYANTVELWHDYIASLAMNDATAVNIKVLDLEHFLDILSPRGR
jgi:hypothetical protein